MVKIAFPYAGKSRSSEKFNDRPAWHDICERSKPTSLFDNKKRRHININQFMRCGQDQEMLSARMAPFCGSVRLRRHCGRILR